MKTTTTTTDRPASKGRMRIANVVGLAVVSAFIASCEFETRPAPPWIGPPPPKVNSIEFHPQYFCSGDQITVTWDTENLDKLELRNNAGDIKLSTTLSSGTLESEPIQASELPLVARGYVGDEFQENQVDDLVNIDNPTWTLPIPSTREVILPNSHRLESAYTEEVMLADGTVQTIQVYEIYVTYSSLAWEAGSDGTLANFSSRSLIDRILNISGPTMNFRSYVAGSALTQVGDAGDIEPDWPATIARFDGDYTSPKEVFFGWQYGEEKKPPDPWFYVDQYYQETTGLVSLRAYCEGQ